ncbi:NADH-quinone oxidoreductase subunit NuoE [Cucumibacter marinus]|uniref:NADH-quinone oxidoreductase subunit NuoE n=1 Tax=Cucumibacter marinus TaxID=1121252 RepID=UPI00041A7AD4|nr:NADH-quinone oxidoreductase subunit NuoE [Cucumibacter marinus]
MSVRRLAEDHVQPQAFAFSKENEDWAKGFVNNFPEGRQASAVIPMLMRAQDQEGWVTKAAIEHIADRLSMPYIRVLEVATFYTQFQLKPVGTNGHIQVCGTTPCMLRGAEDLRSVCQKKINAEPFKTSQDGTMSWEEVECLGACVNAPMVLIGRDTYEDLTPERLEEIIDAFAAGKGDTIKPGPQIDRVFSAAEGGQTTLTDIDHKAASAPKSNKGDSGKPVAKGKKAQVTEESAPAVEGPDDSAKVSQKEAEAEKDALFDRPAGDPDDLKLISGVGKVIEGKLHALGITKYAQIANFTPEQIAQVDERLNFKGRIERDNWLEQADALATGGAEEYRKRFGKEPR